MNTPTCAHCRSNTQADYASDGGVCPACGRTLAPISAAAADVDSVTPETRAASVLPPLVVGATVSGSSANGATPNDDSLIARFDGRGRAALRYEVKEEIARGGMGSVVRAVDGDIRREVAIKYMLHDDDVGQQLRFVEEAQITGQLEHPNIVPIHEIGVDAERRLFFAMKMVKGRSLSQVMKELRAEAEAATQAKTAATWSLGRLLNVLSNVCYAVAYAHSRGVIHRDLKPANIMLGDFGETYVMDWGLAKSLSLAEPATAPDGSPADDDPSSSGSGSRKVATTRAMEGDVTEDGAILGTPTYMSPEQARGEIAALDARSDVYALGAMLYEMLTLLPPVEKEGGATAILTRVARGEIRPPAERTPERARAGKIPKELAAVAMKALSLKPTDRYASVEDLRRDIERFQEGRSVSAREDSAWDAVVRLVRRNRAVSITTVAAATVLAIVLGAAYRVNYAARIRAEDAYAGYLVEQQAKNETIVRSLPAMFRAARQMANEGALPEAIRQMDVVRSYDPDNLDAKLLTAQIRIAEKQWSAGVEGLTAYVRARPDDVDAASLLKLIANGDSKDSQAVIAVANLFHRQHVDGLATILLADHAKRTAERKPLADLYTKQIARVYPNMTVNVRVTEDGELHLLFFTIDDRLSDLTPLAGMQWEGLHLPQAMRIVNIEPLRGMPLRSLVLTSAEGLTNLEPLRGMPLRHLKLTGARKVNNQAIEVLRGMPLELVYLDETGITDLSVLRGMPLKSLNIEGCNVKDLEPLRGASLSNLYFDGKEIATFEPLRGMPITYLRAGGSDKIESLEPLRGMPCEHLYLKGLTKVTSLEPLRGMPCIDLKVTSCPQVTSLEPLRDLPCKALSILGCNKITDLEPLRDMPLSRLSISGTGVRDLTPLDGMNLQLIELEPSAITMGMDVLRKMKTLTQVQVAGGPVYSATTFFQRYDDGLFRQPMRREVRLR